jgi:predicted HTH domain antitoxin
VTLWKAAARCDMSLWDIISEVKKREIHVPYTLEELKEEVYVEAVREARRIVAEA